MFVFCIESSHARGLGHLYRSLTLAAALRERGASLRFLVNDDATALALIRARGHEADAVTLDSDDGWEQAWLAAHPPVRVWINDRLDTSLAHARRVKGAGVGLVTFDDRGGGAAMADLHVAALAFDDADRLQGRRVLSGVEHLLLDPELASWRRPRERAQRWLISMGGADTWGITPRAMQALVDRGLGATVVLGPSFRHGEEVDAVLAHAPRDHFKVHRAGVPSLYEEMSRHDVAITAGGMTPFQANACGLPCVVVAAEVFEIPVARQLQRMGGSVYAGFRTDIDWQLLDVQQPWHTMSHAGMAALDLEGGARVCAALIALAEPA